MKYVFKLAVFAFAGLFATGALAEKAGISLKLADQTARIGVMSETEWMSENYRWDAGLQYDSDTNYIIDTSILYTNKGLVDPNLDLGFKGKLAYTNHDETGWDSYGVMLGAFGRYWLPTPVPSAIVLEGLYGPEILTWGAGKKTYELMARAQAQLLNNLTGFVGVRRFQVDYDKPGEPSHRFENAAHIGIELAF